MADLWNGRLFRIVAVALLVLGVAVSLFDAPIVILVSNALLLSVSSGVVVAYAPVVYGALVSRHPTRGDYLGLGIFIGWLSTFATRVVSIVARDFGRPEIANTHWMSVVLATGLVGGLCHLWAPHAVDGRVPRERWALTGISVAVGVAVIFLLLSLRGPIAVPHPPVQLR